MIVKSPQESRPSNATPLDAPNDDFPLRSPWRQRLVDAETGFRIGIRSESTLFVYFFVGCVILGMATVLELSAVEWAFVVLVLGMTVSAELFHQLFRQMITQSSSPLPREFEQIARLGSAAVFVSNLTALAVLAILFVHRASIAFYS